jgi:hypothetical protein
MTTDARELAAELLADKIDKFSTQTLLTRDELKIIITALRSHAGAGAPVAWRIEDKSVERQYSVTTDALVAEHWRIAGVPVCPLYAALAPMPVERELQPIEDAPKDGTWVLLYSTGINTKYSHWTVGKWRTVGRTSDRGAGWYDHNIFPIHNVVGFVFLASEDMSPAALPQQPDGGEGK